MSSGYELPVHDYLHWMTVEIPLFPLHVVLFPGETLPLHIFEMRYRAMIEHVLATDRRFGVIAIRQGMEAGGYAETFDVGTLATVAQLKRAAADGCIGGVSPRFYGAPTTRSQRSTLERDAPDILAFMREDKVDAAVLVPNCPVCHQTISLTARHLEAAGIPTVIMGCARDIVEHAGVPRFLFSDFPLGNAAGKPHDAASQAATLDLALELLANAAAPRTTEQSPQRWSDDPSWKRDFDNVAVLSAADLARLRAEHERHRAIARAART